MKRRWIVVALAMVSALGCGQVLFAQAGAGGGMGGGPLMGLGLQGKWWNRPALVRRLGITPAQQAKMDEILQQHRLKLVDLRANLQKAEIQLEPLVNADEPNDEQVMAQVKNVAEARAQLEEANARLLLAVRHQLTPTQWQQMRGMIAERRDRMQQMMQMQRMNQMRRQGMDAMPQDGGPDGANLPPAPAGSGTPPPQN